MADHNPTPKRISLDLAALTEVLLVKAPNGQTYPLKSRAARSIVELQKLTNAGKRIDALIEKIPDQTDDEAAELAALLDSTCRHVWEAPDEVHQSLDDRHRLDVIQVFLALHTPTLPATGASLTSSVTPAPSISESSPQSSRDSTGAIPGIG